MSIEGSTQVKRVSIQQELVPSKQRRGSEQSNSSNEDAAIRSSRSERHQNDGGAVYRGRRKKAEPAPTPSEPVSTQPVGNPVPVPEVPAPVSSDLHTLAEQYVDQYAKQAGRSLSTEQRSTLVEDVYSFYSEPSRAGRLKSLVEAGA